MEANKAKKKKKKKIFFQKKKKKKKLEELEKVILLTINHIKSHDNEHTRDYMQKRRGIEQIFQTKYHDFIDYIDFEIFFFIISMIKYRF